MSQQNLADDAGCTQSRISRIENDMEKCGPKTLRAIRKALGIEGMPLLPGEPVEYERKLRLVKDLIIRQPGEETWEMMKDLSAISKLPFEKEFNHAYKIIEIMKYVFTGNFKAVDEIIEQAALDLQSMPYDHQFMYHFHKAKPYLEQNRFKEAMRHLSAGARLAVHDEVKVLPGLGNLYYNMAVCYCNLGLYFRAITMLEGSAGFFSKDEASFKRVAFDLLLGSCYVGTYNCDKAELPLNNALINAKNIKQPRLVGLALRSLGQLHTRKREYETAIHYFNEAAEYLEGQPGKLTNGESLANMYLKGYCLIEMKSPDAEAFVREATDFVKSICNEKYIIMMKSLSCLLKIKEDSSIDYLINTTLPYLLKMNLMFEALDYCNILVPRLRKRSGRRADKVANISNTIYTKMMRGEIDE